MIVTQKGKVFASLVYVRLVPCVHWLTGYSGFCEYYTTLQTITVGCARTTSWLPRNLIKGKIFLMEFWNFIRENSGNFFSIKCWEPCQYILNTCNYYQSNLCLEISNWKICSWKFGPGSGYPRLVDRVWTRHGRNLKKEQFSKSYMRIQVLSMYVHSKTNCGHVFVSISTSLLQIKSFWGAFLRSYSVHIYKD